MLNESEAGHAERMQDLLAQKIAEGDGWISFERFMELALYAPGLGYYSAGAHKLGAAGDFTTAPEISALFGACVARQCAEVLRVLDGPRVLEIGAGSGRLAADVLSRLETLGHLPTRYDILEISADLRERQRARLEREVPHLIDRVHWLDAPCDEPFAGVVLANEVVDALPVTRFRWFADRVEELGVALQGCRLGWAARPAHDSLVEASARLRSAGGDWDDGYTSEYCPRLAAWTTAVTGALEQGAAFWFDYGLPRPQYYFPERYSGTLMCHFKQRAHDDPFLYPGLQDITAWVDFTALAEASRDTGFRVAGFGTQALFLAGLKVDEEMQLIAGADSAKLARLANQARQLMLPGEMGERFKVMAWLRGLDLPLSGFALQDLRHTL